MNRTQPHQVQIGPTPQLKGQLKSILDTASPSPLSKKQEQLVRKKLVFDQDEIDVLSAERDDSLSLITAKNKGIFLSPIKLLQTIDIKKPSPLKKRLQMDLLKENSINEGDEEEEEEDEDDNNTIQGVLSVYNKQRVFPKENLVNTLKETISNEEKTSINDDDNNNNTIENSNIDLLNQHYTNNISSSEDESDIEIEKENIIGKPVQGYMKRRLMEMQPLIMEKQNTNLKEDFNELYHELKRKKLALQEGKYENTDDFKGTLTSDIIPDINSIKKKNTIQFLIILLK
ncbi:hypothetical protein HANVADRAFT_4278 [Hanseniaspora valbyensis NRRL Y-1626]|uniref:Uncharacterized protein n=1 Tax=Hanseniaspora valbyensis NRRL Y-1626 TaxID=766949 RepID=A0A1B7T862_9ASCO|nr:hypothetical protein HANVADRAFT_4278 [Hanseniaspora valbyensis NRRL Y-1626]